jgi:hypothetical protein
MKRVSLFFLISIFFIYACSGGEDTSPKDVSTDAVADVSADTSQEDIQNSTDTIADEGGDTSVNDGRLDGSEDIADAGGDVAHDSCSYHTYAFTVNAAPDYSSGSFSLINFDKGTIEKNKGVIHSDSVARVYGNLVYVVGRLGADNITIYDPYKGFSVVKQFSVGSGSNPQDVAVYSNKIYVSKMASNDIDIYSSLDYTKIGSIDISKYADKDGFAEPQNLLLYQDKLYLTVLRLDKDNYYAPTDKSYLLVIDPKTDKIEKEIELGATNPFAGMVESGGRIFIAETGKFGETDGRIEIYSVRDGIITQQIIPESELGGDLNNITYSGDKLFSVISDSNFNTILIAYDLTSSKKSIVYQSTGFSLAGISIYNGRLYLCDRTKDKPGLRTFSTSDFTQKTTDPIDVGLPPVSLVLLEVCD